MLFGREEEEEGPNEREHSILFLSDGVVLFGLTPKESLLTWGQSNSCCLLLGLSVMSVSTTQSSIHVTSSFRATVLYKEHARTHDE